MAARKKHSAQQADGNEEKSPMQLEIQLTLFVSMFNQLHPREQLIALDRLMTAFFERLDPQDQAVIRARMTAWMNRQEPPAHESARDVSDR